MTVLTASQPTIEALQALFQDATLQTTVGGRIYDDIPENTIRPVVLIEVLGEKDQRGFGTGGLPELDVRIHTFSDVGSLSEARSIDQQIVALMKDAKLTVTGYTQCGRIVYHKTVQLRDQELYGVKVHEVVSLFTITVEQGDPDTLADEDWME